MRPWFFHYAAAVVKEGLTTRKKWRRGIGEEREEGEEIEAKKEIGKGKNNANTGVIRK